ncbi:MAG: EamA family transporter [Hyphomicrobiaceae bacterium]
MTPRDMILAAVSSIVWGLAFVAMKFALDSFTPAQLTALRFLIAAIPALFLPRPRIGWPMLVLIGTTLFTGQFLLLFFAYAHGLPPGLASIAVQMHVFFTVVLAAVFLRDIPTLRQASGIAVAFAGLALIGTTMGGDLSPVALGLCVAGAFSWAIGNVLVKRLGQVDMLALICWLSLVPPLPALLVSCLTDTSCSLPAAVAHASPLGLLATVYLGVVATILGYGIWGMLLARYPTAVVAPFALLAPLVGVLASAVVFGERFAPARYAGMAFILAGLVLVVLPGRRHAK